MSRPVPVHELSLELGNSHAIRSRPFRRHLHEYQASDAMSSQSMDGRAQPRSTERVNEKLHQFVCDDLFLCDGYRECALRVHACE